MTIISVSTSAPAVPLQAGGLSSAKAQRIHSDLAAAIRRGGGETGGVDVGFVRRALDKRIADDVKSGQLSRADAAKVTQSLDRIDVRSSAAVDIPAAANDIADASSAADDDRGGAARSELSRLVTVSGAVRTTIITYSDGSTDMQTRTAPAADDRRYDRAGRRTGSGDVVRDYLASISPGTLIRKAA